MDVKVSVIVPTLNSSKYIKECIDSILVQTLKEIEIICVDAGSIDGTVESLEEYSKSDDRLKVVHSDKKSYGYQMNLGINLANGEYIGIVESDDSIEKDMYEELYGVAARIGADFVKANYNEFRNAPNSTEYTFRKRNILKQQDLYNKVIDASSKPELLLPDVVAIWNGIYQKDYLERNHIKFNETPGASFQDTGFWAWTQMTAKSTYYTNKPFYRYRVDNPNSSTFQASKCFCICDEFEFIRNNIDKGKLAIFAEMLSWIFYRKYKTNLERTPLDLRKDFYERMAKDLSEWNKEFHVTGSRFYQEEWDDLKMIISAPRKYIEQKQIEKKEFLERLKNEPEIVIYGAGRVGKLLAKEVGLEKVSCFVVSSNSTNDMVEIDGVSIPLIGLGDIDNNDAQIIVIASKLSNLRIEMYETATRLGFEKVELIPLGTLE